MRIPISRVGFHVIDIESKVKGRIVQEATLVLVLSNGPGDSKCILESQACSQFLHNLPTLINIAKRLEAWRAESIDVGAG